MSDRTSGPLWVQRILRGTMPPTAAMVRAWFAAMLQALDPPHRDDVLTVVMELLANAYDHAGGPDRIGLTRHRRPCAVRVEVDDRSAGRPVVVRGSLDRQRGRGMLLVADLASDWGIRECPGDTGKTVWAVVGCAGTGRVACRAG